MLTVFGVPKPFAGPIADVQHSAITSWMHLAPGCQVVVLGDEEGVAEAAHGLGVEHVPEVARNEYGTPLLDEVFAAAHEVARHEVLCYANCDIVLPPALADAVARVASWRRRFLLVGRCLETGSGRLRGFDFLDYFIFTRGLYDELPPFAVGRAGFDNWLVWRARASGAPVVDLTPTVLPLHQTHDHGHVPTGTDWTYGGPEAKRNVELAGRRRLYTALDATHRLEAGTVRRNLGSLGRARSRLHRLRLIAARLRR